MSNNEPDKKDAIRPSGRRYSSVRAMMEGEEIPNEVQDLVKELARETRITRQLAEMRLAAGISQEQMATRLGCTQSCISKWKVAGTKN